MASQKMRAVLKKSFIRWQEADPATLGAALSFYALFSLAPLLILAVVILGKFLPTSVIEYQIMSQITVYGGPSVAAVVQTILKGAETQGGGITVSIFSIIAILFGCLGMFSQLELSLDRIWTVKSPSGIMTFLRRKILSVLAVFAIGILLVLSIIVSAFISAIQSFVPSAVHEFLYLIPAGQIISVGAGFLGLVLVYRYLPHRKVAWKAIIGGSIVTCLLFFLGSYGLKLYFQYFSSSSTYGAAGTLAVLLLWMYYSSQIFFFGAALTYSLDDSKQIS